MIPDNHHPNVSSAAMLAKPLFLGVAGLVVTFMTMMMAPPFPTTIVCALLYFGLGFWLGRMQPGSLWYAPLLLNLALWIVFIPMGMDIWPTVIHIWYFLMPPAVGLPMAYAGMFIAIIGKLSRNH